MKKRLPIILTLLLVCIAVSYASAANVAVSPQNLSVDGVDAPARRMIDAGLGVAAASDYNPGSTPSGNMSLVNSLLCIQMRLTPAEALAATTINGAYAMGLSETTGAIAVGLRADLRITDSVPSLAFLPYSFGDNLTRTTLLAGRPA